MGQLIVQNDFTHGQLDKRLFQRSDITLYRKSVARAQNVLVLPWGGLQRRFGTDFIDDILFGSADVMLMAEFKFSVDENYLLVFVGDPIVPELRIYRNTPTGATQVAEISPLPWLPPNIPDLKMTQSTNLMVICQQDLKPQQLFRDDVDETIWTLEDIAFSFFPVHDFNKGNYDAQIFSLGGGPNPMTLTVDVGTFVFTDAHIGGIFTGFRDSKDSSIGYARITARSSGLQVDIEVLNDFSGSGTIQGKNAVVAEKAWSDLEADDSGDRGWPRSTSFYQDRLYFGGSLSLPDTLFGSKVGDFIDFEPRTGLDDDAIQATLGSNSVSPIEHLIGDRDFQIFTATSEWTPRQALDSPITPTTLSVQKHSNHGVVNNVRPIVLDNTTFFVKRGGKGVMNFGVAEGVVTGSSVYAARDISILSTDVLRQPIDSAPMKGFARENSDYVLLVNADGTMAIYQTMQSQLVSAWTLADTFTELEDKDKDGKLLQTGTQTASRFVRVQEVGDDVYVLVEREIGGEKRAYLEKINFDHFTDATISQTFVNPTTTITGLSKLEGQFVQIRASITGEDDDFRVFPQQTVVNGQVTLEKQFPTQVLPGVLKADVGLRYDPLIETLPIIVATAQEGALNYIPKHITRAFISFFESLGILVTEGKSQQRQLIKNLRLGDNFNDLNFPVSTISDCLTPSCDPQTDVQQLYIGNWEDQPTITITQKEPLPMTILAIGYEVTP